MVWTSGSAAGVDPHADDFNTKPLIDYASLREGFSNVPKHAQMRVWWFWHAGQATKQSITQDLEAMKANGIAGALVCDNGSDKTPQGPVFMSEEWQELWAHVIRESTRLGIEISLNIQSGAGDPGNPNIANDNGMKKVVHATTTVSGPGQVEMKLPMPKASGIFYEDVAVQAFKHKLEEGKDSPSWIWCHSEDWATAAAGSRFFRQTFQIGTGDARSAALWITADNAYTVWINGRKVAASNNWKVPIQVSIEKFLKTGTNVIAVEVENLAKGAAGLIAELSMVDTAGKVDKIITDASWRSGKPATENWNSAIKNPAGWQTAVVIGPRSVQPWNLGNKSAPTILPNDVVDLTSKFNEGVLSWDVPAGSWTIIRYGMTATGKRNKYASRGYRGGLCYDQMNQRGARAQFDDVAEPLIEIAKKNGTSLKFLHTDSWEMGPCDWTQGFQEAFKKRRGYDMGPYLPALAGHTVVSQEVSERFREDFRQTISDLIVEDNYMVLKEMAHKNGIYWHSESAGPHMPPLDGLRSLGVNDVPMGEAWARANSHRNTEVRRMHVSLGASAAHIYGKRFFAVEAPTSIGPDWERSPNEVKNLLDRIFCKGGNRLNWHTYDSSPDEFGLPGIAYFAGTHLNRQVTWWKESGAFIDYINRTQHMLSQGVQVADVLGYLGSRIPLFAVLHRLERDDVPAGYAWDMCNADAFLTRASVRDKRIVMPDGKSYALFALSKDKQIYLPVLRKIEKLVSEGMVLVGNPPQRPFGLTGYSESDREFTAIVKRLWGDADGSTPAVITYGKGQVYAGQPVSQVLDALEIGPDLAWSPRKDVDLEYIHYTSVDGEVDIYYVINKWARNGISDLKYRFIPTLPDRYVNLSCSFRVAGDRVIERWDPVRGTITPVTVYQQKDGRYQLPVSLEPEGGAFYVFRKAKQAKQPVATIRRDGQPLVAGNTPLEVGATDVYLRKGKLEVLKGGSYELISADGAVKRIDQATVPNALDISTDWQVSFLERPQLGQPFSTHYATLRSWTESQEHREKYFSGTARYTRDFEVRKEIVTGDHRLYLDLGYVGDIATVRVNGKQVEVLWKAPYALDITDYAKAGQNRIEVDVTNLWINRLVGDATLPPGERKTSIPGRSYTKGKNKYGANRLRASGLIGPVTVTFSNVYK